MVFKKALTLTAQIFIAVLALEFFSYLASVNNLLLFNDTPSWTPLRYEEPLRTEKHPWGAWRDPYTRSRHRKQCFDVEVTTNEFGARDDPFDIEDENSIILLGDSFAEGYGVKHEDTAATLLEVRLKRKVHNLGSSGNFGPLQQYLLYEALAGDIKHNELIIFFLPANDFVDNDRKYWSVPATLRSRYRPYFGEENILTPFYFPSAVPTSKFPSAGFESQQGWLATVKWSLIQYTWSANTLRTARILWNSREPLMSDQVTTFYKAATELQQANVVASYEAIAKVANGRRVSVVIIPSILDIKYLQGDRNQHSYKSEHWYQGLKRIAEKSGGSLVNLLEVVPKEWRPLFFSCDGHWSPAGNAWAAGFIFERVFKNDPEPPYEI